MTLIPPNDRALSRWGVLAMCAIAQFMVVLDVTIVNVALPAMRRDLGLSITGQEWVVNAYTLTFAGFLMLGGRAADLFGRRRLFAVGLALFTGASLLGGLAQGGAWVITARAIQGLGGAILAPTSLTILTSTFTDVAERRRAMGIWSATAASGSAAGVLAGGILTDLLNWRWVLFVNVPIGLAMLVAVLRLPESRNVGSRGRLDVEGAFHDHRWSRTVRLRHREHRHPLVGLNRDRSRARWRVGVPRGSDLHRITDRRGPAGAAQHLPAAFAQPANGIAVTVGAALFGMYFFVSLFPAGGRVQPAPEPDSRSCRQEP